MAINIPANLYGGGQGILKDNFAEFAATQRVKRKAMDEASNLYFDKMLRDINPAGLLPEHQKDIAQKLTNLNAEFTQNKNAILQGGAAQLNFLNKINNIKADLGVYKYRGDLVTKAADATFTGKMRMRENDAKIIEALNKPLSDPSSKKPDASEYSLNDFSGMAKQWTSQDEMALAKAAVGNFTPTYDPNSPEINMGSSGQIIITERFKPEQIKAIGESAANLIRGNNSAEIHYEGLLQKPDAVQKATTALRKVYGDKLPDGSDLIADNAEKMAQGLMIDKAFNTIGQKAVKDEDAAKKFKLQMLRERLANQKAIAIMKEAGKDRRAKERATEQYGIQDNYEIVRTKLPRTTYNLPILGKRTIVDVSNLSKEDREDLFGKQKIQGMETTKYKPIDIKDGKIYLGVDNDGDLIDADGNKLDRTQVLANTLKRSKTLMTEIAKGKATTTITPKGAQGATTTQGKKKISW